MKPARPPVSLIALVLASTLLFGLAGHLVATSFIRHQQARRLDELTEVVLRRSEFAIDFAAASLDELAGRGLADCSPASLQAIRLHVYQRSAVKDVRLVNADGSVICSAYSETLEFDKGWVDRTDMLGSRDAGLLLFRVEQFGGDALGVLRDIDRRKGLVAILGVNSSLFDIMPAELRAHSEVLLALSNGEKLGEFMLDADKALRETTDSDKSSARYPLRTTIRVERAVLSTWNSEGYWPAMALALALGILLSRTRRMEGPVADLDSALARGEFKPYFQPIFALRTGRIIGCEILARWLREDGSVVPPMNFIPLAESSGRIQGMTWQILESALADLQPHLKVRELRDYGFRVAIDDVGVGHSGLSRLKGLGANTIKIDKFFVDTITVDASTTTIVEMLVELARELHMTVVAEGIETEEQVRALISCGVEEGQGYLVAAPLPFARFMALLDARRRETGSDDTTTETPLVA